MTRRILFVDDDELILASYGRTLGRVFELDTALGAEQALEKIAAGAHYAVIVSDMRMPVMDGLQLLRQVHGLSPESVRLILTGNADLRTAIDAVNEGNIFRFLEKPCPHEVLSKFLTSALDQHRLVVAEKEILEQTLHGSIKVLVDVLGLVNPEAFSTASRITQYVKHVVARLGLKDAWRFEMAAMLSQLGYVVLTPDVLETVRLGGKLSNDQQTRFAAHPGIARDLLRNIPRLESIAAMIGRQEEPFGGQPSLPINRRDDETLGAQILKVCIHFEMLIRGRVNPVGAVERLASRPDEYDPALAAILRDVSIDALPCEPVSIEIAKLAVGMVLHQDLLTIDGRLLVAKGLEVTETLLVRIQNFHQRRALPNSIRVQVPL